MNKIYAIKNLVIGVMTLATSFVGAQGFAPVNGIDDIVSKMTVEEKASLCSGAGMWNTKAVERLDVPSIMMTDGPHGVRKQASDGQFAQNIAATCYHQLLL